MIFQFQFHGDKNGETGRLSGVFFLLLGWILALLELRWVSGIDGREDCDIDIFVNVKLLKFILCDFEINGVSWHKPISLLK